MGAETSLEAGLPGPIVDFSSDQIPDSAEAPSIDQRLARLGELTTIVTLISPLPAFIFCHKTSFEKNAQLAKISFNFLLAMMVTNCVWLAYSLKIFSADLILINGLGTLIATTFVTLYLYVKFKVTRLGLHLPKLFVGIIFAILASSSLTDPWLNGLLATTMSMTQYIFILEGVKGVLQTKDPDRVDLIIAVACIFNSLAWGNYALLVGDIFVFIPNVAAFAAGFINIFLYMWTTGKLKDNSFPIKVLHKCCNRQARILPSKVKDEKELESEGNFTTVNPVDLNSHGVTVRETSSKTDPKADQEAAGSSSDEEESFGIDIDGASRPAIKSRGKIKKHVS